MTAFEQIQQYLYSVLRQQLNKSEHNINDVEFKETDNSIQVIAPLSMKFENDGRKPGKMPPIEDIESWCSRNSIPLEAAYPIAKKIGDKGIDGKNFIKLSPDIIDTIEEHISNNIINKFSDGD